MESWKWIVIAAALVSMASGGSIIQPRFVLSSIDNLAFAMLTVILVL
ncbi:hypothetical protein KAT84_04720 [Candidatus Bipolaricaulota bacterium]|nr:hypothetical protein [Candidatus Bipolaricaulota bacterium]